MGANIKDEFLIDEGWLDVDLGFTVKADEFFVKRQKLDAGFVRVVGINDNDLADVWRSALGTNKLDVGFNGLVSHGEHSLIN